METKQQFLEEINKVKGSKRDYLNKPRLFTAIPCEVAEIHVITVF